VADEPRTIAGATENGPGDGTLANAAVELPSHPPFRQKLAAGHDVVLADLVGAKVMMSEVLTAELETRAIGDHDFPLLLAAFTKKHKGVQVGFQDDVGLACALHTADKGDPSGDRLAIYIKRGTLRFDWSEPRRLLLEANELADEAGRWINSPNERRDLLGLLMGIVMQLQTKTTPGHRLSASNATARSSPHSLCTRGNSSTATHSAPRRPDTQGAWPWASSLLVRSTASRR
jgi:hypothetical protein